VLAVVVRAYADHKLTPAAISNLVGHLRRVLWNGAHVRAAEAFEKRHSPSALFGVALSAYFLLWILYFTDTPPGFPTASFLWCGFSDFPQPGGGWFVR
jgi:hypothetical protein